MTETNEAGIHMGSYHEVLKSCHVGFFHGYHNLILNPCAFYHLSEKKTDPKKALVPCSNRSWHKSEHFPPWLAVSHNWSLSVGRKLSNRSLRISGT